MNCSKQAQLEIAVTMIPAGLLYGGVFQISQPVHEAYHVEAVTHHVHTIGRNRTMVLESNLSHS
jgi:hypothetical protein